VFKLTEWYIIYIVFIRRLRRQSLTTMPNIRSWLILIVKEWCLMLMIWYEQSFPVTGRGTQKNQTVKKNQLLEFWKNRPVRFYKPETEKTKQKPKKRSQTIKKPSQAGKKQAKPVWTGFCSKKPNRFFLIRFGYLFLIKAESNRKWSPLVTHFQWESITSLRREKLILIKCCGK